MYRNNSVKEMLDMWEPYFHLIWRSSWECEGLRPTWLLDKSSKTPYFFHCQSLSQRCRVSIAMYLGNLHINIFWPCYMIMRLDTVTFISIQSSITILIYLRFCETKYCRQEITRKIRYITILMWWKRNFPESFHELIVKIKSYPFLKQETRQETN